jgi:hypothetical protein
VIEGDRDGSCPPGQGRAALRLCTSLDAASTCSTRYED